MIQTRTETLPLHVPLRTAQGVIDHRDAVLVRVADPVGIGEATPLAGWTEPFDSTMAALDRVARMDDTRGQADALEAVSNAPAARHALSLAFLDRAARAEGTPLYRTIGPDRSVAAVPVYATIGDGDVDGTIDNVTSAVRDGYECLKLKVGNRSIDDDLARLEAVRSRFPAIELRIDANGAWSRRQAERAIDGAESLDIAYLEQPLPPADLAGLSALRGDVDIAVDETLQSVAVETLIDEGAADVLVCKPMVLGGLDRTQTIAESARDAGLEVVVSNTIDGVVARTGAIHLAASLAPVTHCGLATGDRFRTDLAPDPAPVEGGSMTVPQAAGHGVTVPW